MPIETRHSFCRFCHASCAIEVDVDVDRNRVVAVRGDRADPIFEGFTCVKGRHLGHQHHHPDRLRTSLRADGRGGFTAVPTREALDEIAGRLARLIDAHGPRTVASYCGTAAYQNATVLPVARAFHAAIGSPSFYTSSTIDQPAKFVAPLRHGAWMAGTHSFTSADVVMVIGMNTVVSHYGWPGTIPGYNPLTQLLRAKQRGLKLIVVDPRRTEVANHADIHLQVRPGEDPTLLAAMVRLLIDEDRIDHAFVDRWVTGLAELRAALEPFTLGYAEARTGVPAPLIAEAARLFAAGPRGTAGTGTGPNMAPHPSLTEHLTMALNTLCGRYNREGDVLPHLGGVFSPPAVPKAQPVPPKPEALTSGPAARVRDLHAIRGEAPTAALADEILLPGEGQVRALLTIGGNPVVAWPDQDRVLAALRSLDTHVAVDAQLSATAKLAHYVLASELCLERPDITTTVDRWFEQAYSTYTPAVLAPEGDVIAEWAVYTGIASRLGVTLTLPGGTIAPGDTPTTDDVLDLIYAKGKITPAEVRARYAQGGSPGRLHPELAVTVAPADEGVTARLDLCPAGLAEELAEVADERTSAQVIAGFDPAVHRFRVTSRRLKSVFNSSGREIEVLRAKEGTSWAHVHPEDLHELGIADGELVELVSPSGVVRTLVKASPDVVRGSVSMAHAWGDVPLDEQHRDGLDPAVDGDATAALIDATSGYDRYSGIPALSAIPVAIRRPALT